MEIIANHFYGKKISGIFFVQAKDCFFLYYFTAELRRRVASPFSRLRPCKRTVAC
jgi:hypothetical protein